MVPPKYRFLFLFFIFGQTSLDAIFKNTPWTQKQKALLMEGFDWLSQRLQEWFYTALQ